MVKKGQIFDSVKVKVPKSNKFNLSHSHKLTLDFGMLVPVGCYEVIPGDKWRVQSNIFMRLMPMVGPVMHNCDVYIHNFFVPYRLLYDNWEKFITGGREGNFDADSTNFPRIDLVKPAKTTAYKSLVKPGSLMDYLGFPQLHQKTFTGDTSLLVSALPFKAYQLIFNEYYRDQNLSDEVNIADTEVGEITRSERWLALMSLRYRAYEKDYFTSALPFAQRGRAVTLLDQAQQIVKLNPSSATVPPFQQIVRQDGSVLNGNLESAGPAGILSIDDGTGAKSGVWLDPAGSLYVDNELVTIERLRQSMRLQEWLEKNARGGSRYVEQLLMHFGVKSSDARLGRPEYLGGGRQPIVMSEVTQTSGSTAEGNVLGDFAGHGISAGSSNRWHRYFEEHGIVMQILSVLPRTGYYQGVNRVWTKFNRLDFPWPEFANLGEQEIKNKELFISDSNEDNEGTFGYTPRYSEYKYIQDRISADMQGSLKHWNLARGFANKPNLNVDFVTCKPADTNGIFAQGVENNHLVCEVQHNIDAIRKLPVYGTPTY